MRQTIYIDVLLGVNLFINYFLLLTVAKFLSLYAKRWRLVLGAAVGAVFSLTVLLPELSAVLTFAMKLGISGLIVLAAFRFSGWPPFFRQLAAFYIVSFSFAGLMLALWYFIAPQGLIVKNSIVYFDVSPLLLLILTVFCYFLIRLIQRFTGRQTPKNLFYPLQIEWKGKEVACVAKVDTGNSLVEPFSGLPVVVCRSSLLEQLTDREEALWLRSPSLDGPVPRGCRLVAFHSVGGGGFLGAVRPDRLKICRQGQWIACEGYLAASDQLDSATEAILNPRLLRLRV